MKPINRLTTLCLFLTTLGACQEQPLLQPLPGSTTQPVSANAMPPALGGIITNNPALPAPTIVEQTYVSPNDLWADTRCRAWRITWPTYPAGTSPNLIPTMFSVPTGTPYSINFLNNTPAANTYKTSFNLYYQNKLASVNDMWNELTYAFDAVDKLEQVRFNKSPYSAATIETWVKSRPSLFELRWETTNQTDSKIENYQKGDIYLYKLVNQNRYGGIRIVSMTPRIIEIYFAEPNY